MAAAVRYRAFVSGRESPADSAHGEEPAGVRSPSRDRGPRLSGGGPISSGSRPASRDPRRCGLRFRRRAIVSAADAERHRRSARASCPRLADGPVPGRTCPPSRRDMERRPGPDGVCAPLGHLTSAATLNLSNNLWSTSARSARLRARSSSAGFDAPNDDALKADLARQGLYLFSHKRASAGFSFSSPRVKTENLQLFGQELAALLKAGLPLAQAMDLMVERQREPALQTFAGRGA